LQSCGRNVARDLAAVGIPLQGSGIPYSQKIRAVGDLQLEYLSSEDSPYLFSTLPVEILGSVYQRFIGKAIYVSKDNKAKAELKPELRKAEGVFYTPHFIVNFIVGRTVGRILKGKSPREVAKLRFVDPSCGSGSFLMRVFEAICEHHLRWFQENSTQQKPELCYRDDQNALQLTTHIKRQIML
jgi:adenine-specific DNA-methyltransferase